MEKHEKETGWSVFSYSESSSYTTPTSRNPKDIAKELKVEHLGLFIDGQD